MMYQAETLTYEWFVNYILALAITTFSFVVVFMLSKLFDRIMKIIKKEKSNGKENDINSR